MNADSIIRIQGRDTGVLWSVYDSGSCRIRSLAVHLVHVTDKYMEFPAKYGDGAISSQRFGSRNRALRALSDWVDGVGKDPLARAVEALLCSSSKMLEEALVQLETPGQSDSAVCYGFSGVMELLCEPQMDLREIPAEQLREAVSILHHRAIGLTSTPAWQGRMRPTKIEYGPRQGILADWFLLHAALLGAFADPLPLTPGEKINQEAYDAYTSALRARRPKLEEYFPRIFAATWDKYKIHPMWSDDMAGGFNPITGTYNESAPQRRPSTNPRSSMSARKRSYLDSLTAAPIPSDPCDSQGVVVPALPDPNPDLDPTKKEAPMAAPAVETPQAGSVTVIEEVRLNPGDSYFSAVFSMLKLGGSTALAAKMSDGMATLIMERLPRALPFLAPLLMIPGISKAFALASPPLIGWLCHNRYIPKMFLSEQKQYNLAVWCLLATLGQTNKFLYDLGDDLMGKLWKSMRDILEDEDEALLKRTMKAAEPQSS